LFSIEKVWEGVKINVEGWDLIKPHPGKSKTCRRTLNFCNTLLSKPFSLYSTPEFGDLHNVLLPSFPDGHNNQESTLFAKCLEPIHSLFPSGPVHIPEVEEVEENNMVLEEVSKQPVEEVAEGCEDHGGPTLLTQRPPGRSQRLPTYDVVLTLPLLGLW
jgi:hypothetical protein